MLKQGIKTINTEFIQTCALLELSFVQFRSYATFYVSRASTHFDINVKK